jgi:hypothetical protein
MKTVSIKKSAVPISKQVDYFATIFTSIVDFLLSSGAKPELLSSRLAEQITRFQQTTVSGRQGDANFGHSDVDTVFTAVLHRWHREPKLLDSRARPAPLRLYGPSPSVESLVRAESTPSRAKSIVQVMLAIGLLDKAPKNRYLPKSRVATVGSLHPVVVEHVAKSLSRYLETITRNTGNEVRKLQLIERFAHIPNLPAEQLDAFQAYSQDHGTAFLAGVDDWLESRRPKGRASATRPGLAAGIHLFAYVENTTVPTKRTTPRRAKRA